MWERVKKSSGLKTSLNKTVAVTLSLLQTNFENIVGKKRNLLIMIFHIFALMFSKSSAADLLYSFDTG